MFNPHDVTVVKAVQPADISEKTVRRRDKSVVEFMQESSVKRVENSQNKLVREILGKKIKFETQEEAATAPCSKEKKPGSYAELVEIIRAREEAIKLRKQEIAEKFDFKSAEKESLIILNRRIRSIMSQLDKSKIPLEKLINLLEDH
jgi:hypothetical protein